MRTAAVEHPPSRGHTHKGDSNDQGLRFVVVSVLLETSETRSLGEDIERAGALLPAGSLQREVARDVQSSSKKHFTEVAL
jgi:hypothetical protein